MYPTRRLFLMIAALLVNLTASAAALPIPSPPILPAKSYILIDAESGQVLASENPNKRVAPASITKLVTCYIIFKDISQGIIKPSDMVTVSKKSWEMHGSQMFLTVGHKISVNNLLFGLITDSGNDAAVSLAQDAAGSTATFVKYMNQTARQLGMTNSHFMDVTGLPHSEHYMSARDIATVYAAIVNQFPGLYKKYFHRGSMTWDGITQYNRNKLLWTDPRVDGGKTGHTKEAGYNLAASAVYKGMRVISVVTGTDSNNARLSQCDALINYAYHFYTQAQFFKPGDDVAHVKVSDGAQNTVPVVVHEPVDVAYPRGQRSALTIKAELSSQPNAPVKKGAKLGTLTIAYNGKTLKQVPVYAGASVAQGSYFNQFIAEIESIVP